jgi:hypothetical protein
MCNYFKLNSFNRGFYLVVIVNFFIFFCILCANKLLIKISLIYHLINKCINSSLAYGQKSLAFGFTNISLMWGSLIFVQLIYIIPLIIILGRERQGEIQKGVIFASIFTALLTGSCFADVIKCHFY